MIQSMPINIMDIVITIFNTCSVAAFTNVFKMISTNIIMNDKDYTPDQVCRIAEKQYCQLKDAGKWDGLSPLAMLSKDKDSEDKDKDSDKKGRDP
eukprot:4179286-Ditylum_brightwellii.AAC.1